MTRTRCRMDRQAARIISNWILPAPTTHCGARVTVVLVAHDVR